LVTISIVSHNQSTLVNFLLIDLSNINFTGPIILTSNLPGDNFEIPEKLLNQVRFISPPAPKGFGANHNYAFRYCNTPYFAILNPDIRIPHNPFENLQLGIVGETALIAPAILGPSGQPEDNARHFPTPLSLIKKVIHMDHGHYPYQVGTPPFAPDWVGGMFMMIKSDVFRQLNGFDEGFFLYYEDVDLCARLQMAGWKVKLDPSVSAIHHAQRASHQNIKYLKWHVLSMVRYLVKHSLWLLRRKHKTF